MTLLVLLSIFSSATPVSAAADPMPETVIELSISELIPKRERERSLPPDYGARAIKVLEAAKPRLHECLVIDHDGTRKIDVRLAVAPNGEVVEASEVYSQSKGLRDQGGIDQCVLHTLSKVRFPSHPLKTNVVLKLPVSFEREVL